MSECPDQLLQVRPTYWVNDKLATENDIEEFESVPLEKRNLPKNTYELLRDGASISPENIALEYFPDAEIWTKKVQCYTFREVFYRITQTANLFNSLGIHSSDAISLMLTNIPESQFALWGAQAAGIANPINWMLEPHIIANLVKSAGSRVLVISGSDKDNEMLDKLFAVVSLAPDIEVVIQLSGSVKVNLPEHITVIRYAEVINQFNFHKLDSNRKIRAHDIACYFPTGGTTSAPKLAVHTHKNEVTSAWLSATFIALNAGESRLLASPLFHVVGAVSISLSTLGRGSKLVIGTASGWRGAAMLKNLWHIVQDYRLNIIPMIPTILGQLTKNTTETVPVIDSLRVVTCGSAPLSELIASKFRDLTGKAVCEGYGMTETTSVIMMNPHAGTIKTGSVGIRFPYHSIRIVSLNIDNGISDVPNGEVGLLLVSGPAVISDYKDLAMSMDLWIEEKWFNTGDLARQDADGYVWITGRIKEIIIRGGHNIDPKPIEEMFYGHPAVLEVALVGRPDAYAGEIPVAYIALAPDSNESAETMLEYAKKNVIERAATPKFCYLVPTLPKTAVGKIDKNKLRADATEKAVRTALMDSGLQSFCHVLVRNMGIDGIDCSIYVKDKHVNEKVKDALSQFTINFTIVN